MVLHKKKKISGHLGSLSLPDLIQLLGVNKRTATLRLDMKDESGTIYFRDGLIQHAETRDIEGENAILKFIDWSDASFVIEEGLDNNTKVTMSGDAEGLMLKLCSKLDEQRHRGESFGAGASGEPTNRNAAELHPEFADILARTERRRISIPIIASIAFVIIVLTVAFRGQLLPDKGTSPAAASTVPGQESSSTAFGDQEAPKTELEPSTGDDGPADHSDASLQTSSVDDAAPAENPMAGDPREKTTSAEPSPSQPRGAGEPAQELPANGYLSVRVDPSTEIFVDGESKGVAPLGQIQLSAEDHSLRLSHQDYFGAITDQVRIRGGETLTKTYSFSDLGYLQVVVQPWAEVYIDGRYVGQTPFSKIKVTVGKHTVMLRHPQLGEKRAVVEIQSNETTRLRQQM
jgi:hypothetical protein